MSLTKNSFLEAFAGFVRSCVLEFGDDVFVSIKGESDTQNLTLKIPARTLERVGHGFNLRGLERICDWIINNTAVNAYEYVSVRPKGVVLRMHLEV